MPTYAFDVAKANALLDEAGYPKGADGIRFTLKLLPAPYFNETKQFGDYLRQALAAVGIDAELVNNDAPGAHEGRLHRPRLRPRDRADRLPRRSGDLDDDPRRRAERPTACPSPTRAATRTPRLDALIAKANETIDVAARTELFKEFQELVADDLPLINVAEWGFITVARDQRAERLQQPALGGLQLGGYRAGIVIDSGKVCPEDRPSLSRAFLLVRRRLISSIPVLLIVIVGTFLLLEAAPGDAVDAYLVSIGGGDPAWSQSLRESYGLDQSHPRPALALPHRARPARPRLVGRLRPADPRRHPRAPAQHAAG